MLFRGGNCFCGERKCENFQKNKQNLLLFFFFFGGGGGGFFPPKGPEKKKKKKKKTVTVPASILSSSSGSTSCSCPLCELAQTWMIWTGLAANGVLFLDSGGAHLNSKCLACPSHTNKYIGTSLFDI